MAHRSETVLAAPVDEHDHVLGLATAPVTLVEYGDFECPFCREARPVVRDIVSSHPEAVRLVFRHFPVVSLHAHARRAAEAAECAASQGRFWEMHDEIFEHHDALGDDDLLGYARTIGLDLDRFRAELEAQAHRQRVQRDVLSGIRGGVSGTPTFFVNGTRHLGRWERAELLEAI